MNAVEIEEAVSALAEQPFDAAEFPYAFLEAFGNKATTIKRLRSGATNKSDIPGAVLQRDKLHIAVCGPGSVPGTLAALEASPATARHKAKFIVATDGTDFHAENRTTGDTVACAFTDFPNHFGIFLPLAGISTVKAITENTFDIRATGRLNKLYVELLKDNQDWGTAARRPDMNHFMARLRHSDWGGELLAPKNGRIRVVGMTERLASALRRQRHLRSSRVLCKDDGTPLTRQGAWSRVRYAAKRAKVSTGVHILRHTFCSHLALRGAPGRAVQELAGHSELGPTQRYMHLSPAALDAAIQLLEPRGNSETTASEEDAVERNA